MKAKNIGLLATLAMVVTVGGVYATWNYAHTTPEAVTFTGLKAGITTSNQVLKGELKADLTFSATVENDGNYKPIIDWTNSGETKQTNVDDLGNPKYALNVASVTVGFKPDVSYEAQFGKSINLQAAISFTGNTWNDGANDHAIFTAHSPVTFTIDWTSLSADASGYYNKTVDVSALFELVDATLDTKGDYDKFETGLTATSATITVSENI